MTAIPDEWLSMTEPGLLLAPAFSPSVFLSKTNSYNNLSVADATFGAFAQISSEFDATERLSPFSGPILRARRGSTHKLLILLARTLPLFALFGPPDCL